jgi:hypothetical protein
MIINKKGPTARVKLAALPKRTTEVLMDRTNNNMGGRKEVATVNLQVAAFALQDYQEMLDKSGDAVDAYVYTELRDRFLTAEQEYRSAQHECSCRPDNALVCLACKRWLDAHYGDEIPFRGE